MNAHPRVYVRRNPRHVRRQRYSYTYNRHRYPVETLRLVGLGDGFARTLLGAFIAAYIIPVTEGYDRLHSWVFREKEWWT